MYKDEIIRFDWAMKRLLRQKANFVVLESLLSELLGEKITIRRMLESEGNKENADDKFMQTISLTVWTCWLKIQRKSW